MKLIKTTSSSLLGATIAAIAASLCCVAPLVLLTLGIGGAWVSTLTQFEFLRPWAIGLTLLLLGLAFWQLYITPKRCPIDKPCAKPKALYIYRIIYWIVAVLLILLLSFPWYANWFY